MSNDKIQCPACGAITVTKHREVKKSHLVLGQDFQYEAIFYKCQNCSEEGDFTGESDKNLLASKKNAQAKLVKDILDDMHEVGITMVMFERVFELPFRTLTRWKNGDFSATALALLRLVATYPWLIGVAENRFERQHAKIVVINVATEYLVDLNSPVVTYSSIEKNNVYVNPNVFNDGVQRIEAGA